MRERNKLVASCTPPTRDLACNPGLYPDWDSTGNLSVCGMMPNPLSYTSQGYSVLFKNSKSKALLHKWLDFAVFQCLLSLTLQQPSEVDAALILYMRCYQLFGLK